MVDADTADDIEREFYEAMRSGDVGRMMALWSDEEEIVCVHPGSPRIVGPLAIRASYEGVFASGGVAIEPEQVRRVRSHASEVHSVVERLEVETEDGPRTVRVLATNVYLHTGLGWRMVAHHASPGSVGELQEVAETATTLH